MGRPRLENRTDRKRPITVSVTPRDRAAIEERAEAAGLPLSVYVRSAALGRPASRGNPVQKLQEVRALIEVNADQARIGNLLKWALKEADSARRTAEIERLIRQIGAVQDRLSEVMKGL